MRGLLMSFGVGLFALALSSGSFASAASAGDNTNPLTPGNVSLHLKIGQTTQAEVLEVFGAPNIVTQDGQRQEVWSYQRHATVTRSQDDGAYFNVLIFGVGGAKASSEQTQRTMTLIIKFDANHMVSDFSSRASEF
jgi:outer membrane protein assembly factor BamE (lipoprotein component of BamABCDE complex)